MREYVSLSRGYSITYFTTSATGNVSTTSGTFSVITGMSITPPLAGSYLVFFSGTLFNTVTNTTGEYSLFVNAVQQKTRGIDTQVQILGLITLTTALISVPGALIDVVSVTGTDAVDIRYRRTAGAGNIGCGDRSLSLVRVF